MNHLKLVVDNIVSDSTLDYEKSFEKMKALTALSRTLESYPALQSEINLQSIKNRINNLKTKIISNQESLDRELVEQVKEKYSDLLNKRTLQNEIVDFCKSIDRAIVCVSELEFSLRFAHHGIVGVISQYPLNDANVMLVFTGVTNSGRQIALIAHLGEILTQDQLDKNTHLKESLAHNALAQNFETLTEEQKEFLCLELDVSYGENNVIELPSNHAKVLTFQRNEDESEENGPNAG